MWLKLNIEGFIVYFQIKGYKPSRSGYSDDLWCDIKLTVEYGNDFKIHRSGGLLYSDEIEHLLMKLQDLLANRIQNAEEIDFMEPDFVFVLDSQLNLLNDINERNNRGIFVDFQVHFWNGILTENYLSLRLYKENIEYLLYYIKLVTRQLKKTDKDITDLIEKGVILDYQP